MKTTMRLPMFNGKFLANTPMTDADATAMETAHLAKLKKSASSAKQKATNAVKAATNEAVAAKEKALRHAEFAKTGKTISYIRSHSRKAIAGYKAAKAAYEAAKKANEFKTPKANECVEIAKDAMDMAKMAANLAFEAGAEENAAQLMMNRLNTKFNHR